MVCFRPTKKQWTHLRQKTAGYNKVFESAYRRWKAGELIIGDPAAFSKEALAKQLGSPFVLTKDYEDIPDADTARAILEAHLFIQPLSMSKDLNNEKKMYDREISAFMKANEDVIAIDAMTGEPIQ